MSTGTGAGQAVDQERLQRIFGALKREGEMGESAIAKEAGLRAEGISALLERLEHDGRVARTAFGRWRLTPAEELHTEPRPHPREPKP
ncbi:MAG: hypothetical protein ACJ76V_04035 [Thermoleophilaceae bacterium]